MIRWLVVGAGGAGRAHAAALREVRGAALAGIVAPEGASGVDLPSGTPVFPDLARALGMQQHELENLSQQQARRARHSLRTSAPGPAHG